jgi:ABC-2 type transport system permease protein
MISALVRSELRQRLRGKRWWLLLIIWTLVLFGLTWLSREGAKQTQEFVFSTAPIGPIMFGALALFVLGLSCLVVPALTSTSINSERTNGTLAVLQSTMLRGRDIVLAKFLAALISASAFLAATVPLALWSASEGGVSLGRAVVVYGLLFLSVVLLICIGLACSAIFRKPSVSSVAAYAVVGLLTIGSPIIYGLSLLSAEEVGFQRQVGSRWLLLAPNPFVVLADAAPSNEDENFQDPLEGIRDAVRESRRAPYPIDPETGIPLDQNGDLVGNGDFLRPWEDVPPPLWPAGMAIDVAIAGLAAALATRKLKIPAQKLAIGERVA